MAPHRTLLAALAILLLTAGDPPCASAQFLTPQVVLETAQGEVTVPVELARTQNEMARGLMYRHQLAEDAGMLFLYSVDADHSFWMKNTYIPLDMIFIDRDRVVAGMVENTEPLTLSSRRIGKPSRYVLEVNAGFARRHGITSGTRVHFLGIADAAAPR